MSLGLKLLENIPRRPLVVHFDLNRTIIEVDLAGGKTLRDILNNNLASVCQGICDPSQTPLTWKPVSDPDGKLLPGWNDETVKKVPEKHRMKYDEFVDEVIAPRPKEMGTLPKEEALEVWKKVTAKRRLLKNKFCEQGEPGHLFFDPFYTDMHAKMLKEDGKTEHFVIPAFYTFVNTLWQAKWPFRLVFRTFGRELSQVLKAVENDLAEKNPSLWAYVVRHAQQQQLFNASSASASSASVLHQGPASFPWCPVSALYRDAKVGQLVCHGADFSPSDLEEWKRNGFVSQQTSVEDLFSEFTGIPYQQSSFSANNNKNDEKEQQQQQQQSSPASPEPPHSTAIRFRGFVDHYPWWAANGEHESAGKSFPVRTSPFQNEHDPYQLFFDDNIFIGDSEGHSILDLRDVTTHEHISDVDTGKCFMVRCEPRNAILDEFYFVRELSQTLLLQHKLRSKK